VTTNVLNTEFIKRRRVEVGLSNRALAAAVGTTLSGLRALERDASQGDLTLAFLERLAGSLGCSINDLIATPAPATPVPVDEPDLAADAATLGRLLYAAGVLTPVAALSEITGWPDQRVNTALEVLGQGLPTMGLVLHRLGNRVAIKGSGDVDGDLVAAAVRSHLNRDGLNITEMRLLRRILDGDTPPQPTNSEQVALGVLANARLIEPDGPGGWKVHLDVVFSVVGHSDD
jgi:transcriptional regulator with XRE-family HTH domain